MVGERITTIAFISIASSITTKDSSTSTSLIGALQIFPIILFSFTGGYLADIFPRKKFLLTLNFIRCLIVLIFLYLFQFFQSLPLIYISVFLLGVLTSLYNPAKKSFVPFLVQNNSKEIKYGNKILIASEIIAMLVGVGIGTILLNFIPSKNLLLFDASAFLVAIIILTFLPKGNTFFSTQKINQVTEFRKSINLIKNDKQLLGLIISLIIPFYLSAGLFYASTSHWASIISPANTGEPLGKLFLSVALGAIGSYFLNHFFDNKNEYNVIKYLFLFSGLSVFGLYFATQTNVLITYVSASICGVFIGLLYNRTIYMFQLIINKDDIGKITSLNEIVFSISFVVVILFTISASNSFTYKNGYCLTAILLTLSFILNGILFKKYFNNSVPIK